MFDLFLSVPRNSSKSVIEQRVSTRVVVNAIELSKSMSVNTLVCKRLSICLVNCLIFKTSLCLNKTTYVRAMNEAGKTAGQVHL